MKFDFKKIFAKKNFDEEEYLDQIVSQTDENAQITMGVDVIRYFIDQNGKSKYPTISKVCNFSGEVLPEVGAIIWGPDPTHKFMMPYKVARIDFMEDEADGISTQHRILIVVRPASNDQIVTQY